MVVRMLDALRVQRLLQRTEEMSDGNDNTKKKTEAAAVGVIVALPSYGQQIFNEGTSVVGVPYGL
jgi:hypothetical protein